jgi:DNA (cytosine-5)-methyltransferase 1
MNTNKQNLKAIELFAGAGGMALGMQMAGVDVIGLVEKDRWCLATLENNRERSFPKAKIIEADINLISGEWILQQVEIKKGELDILSGGPPCQGFTSANSNRSIDDPRSKMMYQFIKLVDEIQPRVFIIENVKGLLSFKDFFRELLGLLESKGYVVRFNLMNAASYGVPQNRLRIFIIGYRNDQNKVPVFPVPEYFDPDDNTFPSKSLVSVKCFAVNGFSKEEVNDVWWNTKINIMMNKKTACEIVEQAVRENMLEEIFYNR